MSDIHGKTGQILNRGSAQQIGGSVGGAYDNTVAVKVLHILIQTMFTILEVLPPIQQSRLPFFFQSN